MIKLIRLLPVIIIINLIMVSCSGKFSYQALNQDKGTGDNDQTEEYVLGSSDIPLFSGLKQIDEKTTNFDTISGNIVISSYDGEVKLNEVKYFYIGALPQLGWQLTSEEGANISYKRNDDILEISFKQSDNNLLVKFFISETSLN